MTDKVLMMIGLAKRAGRVVTGAEQCEKEIRKGNAKLIVIADDISDNGKKAMTDCCRYYHVPYIQCGTKQELGKFTGAEERAAVAVCDSGFANAVLDRYRAIGKKGR